MVKRRHTAAAIVLASCAAVPTFAAATSNILDDEPACAGVLASPPPAGRARPAGIADLLGLRDIGLIHLGDLGQAMTVSPDGRQISFVISRGDPKTNRYCQVLVVVPTDGSGRVRALDLVGQPDLSRGTSRGFYNSSGLPEQNVPLWSPDGARIAYKKRAGTRGEAWQVDLTTGHRERVSPDNVDVERIGWLDEGRSLAIAYRTGREEAATALSEEGRSGYLFDDRFVNYTGNQPLRRANLPLAFRGIELSTGRQRDLADAEKTLLGGARALDFDTWSLLTATSRSGRRTWTAPENPKEWPSPVRIWASDGNGKPVRCEQADCIGDTAMHYIPSLWWSQDGETVFWLRRTGWGDGDLGFYRWRPGAKAVKVAQTSDMLIDCQQSSGGLFCLQESAASPRKIVRIDEGSGRWRTVFDPNPEWQSLRLGRVERLHWRNDNGFEVFGDLILPPDYRAGTRVPLIVTQYSSRGFLRGGTGDEFPIFPFAARGYAVLSYNMPKFYNLASSADRWTSRDEAERANTSGWRNRENLLSALEAGVDLVIAKGIADPHALGITGVSDGSTTGQFAIVDRPDRFAAASLSACCLEPQIMMVFGGIALEARQRSWDFPSARVQDLARWKPISLSLNAGSVRTPLLLSNGDAEYLVGVEAFMALRDAGKAVEMYIYPGEYHLKVQPEHREAVYKRNLAWFDFWLRRREDRCLASQAEYDRWRKMPGAPHADQLTRSRACPPGP